MLVRPRGPPPDLCPLPLSTLIAGYEPSLRSFVSRVPVTWLNTSHLHLAWLALPVVLSAAVRRLSLSPCLALPRRCRPSSAALSPASPSQLPCFPLLIRPPSDVLSCYSCGALRVYILFLPPDRSMSSCFEVVMAESFGKVRRLQSEDGAIVDGAEMVFGDRDLLFLLGLGDVSFELR